MATGEDEVLASGNATLTAGEDVVMLVDAAADAGGDNKDGITVAASDDNTKTIVAETKPEQTSKEQEAKGPEKGGQKSEEDAAAAQAQDSEMTNADNDNNDNNDTITNAEDRAASAIVVAAAAQALAVAADEAAAMQTSEQLVHSTLLADLESNYAALQNDYSQLQTASAEKSNQLSKQTLQMQALEKQVHSQTEELSLQQRQAASLKHAKLEAVQEAQLHKERLSRLIGENDSLREELSRNSAEKTALQKSLQQLETSSKLSTSSTVPLRLELERSKVETEAVTAHSKWLQDELAAKNSELCELKTQHASEVSQYRTQAMAAQSEAAILQSRVACLQKDQEATRRQLEASETALSQTKRDHVLELQRHAEELHSEQHLVRLQTSHAQKLEDRAQSLGRQMENLQQLAVEAEESQAKQQSQLQTEARQALEELRQEHEADMSEVQQQLEASQKHEMELKRELQLVDQRRQRAMRRGGGGDVALIEGEASGAAGNELVPFQAGSPSAANNANSSANPSFTDLLDRLTFAEEEVMEERAERKRIELLFKKTQLDIESKMPVIRAQRREYQQAMRFQEEARTEVQDAQRQVEVLQSHLQGMKQQSIVDNKERVVLQKELQVLAQQVQTLLHNKVAGDADGAAVTFTSVAQLQTRNQELIQSQARLQQQVEELEQETNHGALKRGLVTAKEELSHLREEREHQATLVAGIVQQRDMYRVLLSQHDATFTGSGAAGSNTGTMVSVAAATTALSPTKSSLLQRELQDASGELSAAKAELMHAKSENQGLDERCHRLDTLRQELTSSLQSKQTELLQLVSVKTQSEASEQFWHQKCSRQEEHVESLKKELAAIQNSRRDLQQTVAGLEQSLQQAQSSNATQLADQRQMQALVRRLEAQVDTSRQSEARLAAQAEAARADLSRQGALLDSVQRIEAGLSAKTAQELESLKEELAQSKREIAKNKQAHESALEQQTHTMEDGQLRLANALMEKGEAVQQLLEAEKIRAESKTKVLELQAKVKSYEKTCADFKVIIEAAQEKVSTLESSSTNKAKDGTIQALTTQLQDAKSDLAQVRERLLTYQTIAKQHENNAADLAQSTKALEAKHETELSEIKQTLAKTLKEAEAKQVALTELGDELSTQRTLQNEQLEELRQQIAMLETKLQAAQTQAQTASEQLASVQGEIASHKADAVNATTNYERELALHSDARAQLGRLRTEVETHTTALAEAQAQLERMANEVSQKDSSHEAEKQTLMDAAQQAEQRVKDVTEQNKLLHNQMSNLAASVEQRMQAKSEVAADSKDSVASAIAAEGSDNTANVAELRQVVEFMRSERTVLDGQMETLKRAVARESSAAVVARQSLDAARVELKVLQQQLQQGGGGGSPMKLPQDTGSDGNTKKLAQVEEQLTLTRESNQLLRAKTAKLQTQLEELQKQQVVAKSAVEPLHQQIRQLQTQQTSSEAQRASLEREAEAWKGRVQSLVSKFHPIDPEEHKQALAKVQSLEAQSEGLRAQQQRSDTELTASKQLIIKLNKEVAQNKTKMENLHASLLKTKTDHDTLAKSTTESTGSSVKHQEELKTQLEAKTKEVATLSIDLSGQKRRVENFTRMLRQYKEKMADLTTELSAAQKESAKAQASFKEQLKAKDAQQQEALNAAKEQQMLAAIAVAAAEADAPKAQTPPPVAETTSESAGGKAKAVAATIDLTAESTAQDVAMKEESKPAEAAKEVPKAKAPAAAAVSGNKRDRGDAGGTAPAAPEVPEGGFRFAPSREQPKQVTQVAKKAKAVSGTTTATTKAEPSTPAKAAKTPAGNVEAAKPAVAPKTEVPTSARATGSQSASFPHAPTPTPTPTKAPAGSAQGQVKEQQAAGAALREKLLMKRKKLKEMADKQRVALEEQKQQKDKAAEKKAEEAAPPKPAVTESVTPSREKQPAASQPASEKKAAEKSSTKQNVEMSPAAKASTSTAAGAGSAFAPPKPAVAAPAPAFGSAPSGSAPMFGSGSAPSGFGSAFGGGKTPSSAFGSSSSKPALSFGSSSNTTGASMSSVTGGAPSVSGSGTGPAASSGFGLNLAPPGTTVAAPFSFGSTTNIKLAIPSKPAGSGALGGVAPPSSPFGAFARASSFSSTNSNTGNKPLFGGPGAGGGGFGSSAAGASKPLFGNAFSTPTPVAVAASNKRPAEEGQVDESSDPKKERIDTTTTSATGQEGTED